MAGGERRGRGEGGRGAGALPTVGSAGSVGLAASGVGAPEGHHAAGAGAAEAVAPLRTPAAIVAPVN